MRVYVSSTGYWIYEARRGDRDYVRRAGAMTGWSKHTYSFQDMSMVYRVTELLLLLYNIPHLQPPEGYE